MMSLTDVYRIENMRQGAMERLGLDYEKLKIINPGLIYASLSGSEAFLPVLS
jgi:crotonobetainyl-CoA:carnitine CoA-transferase CaiB-like acyl-CoA transferase